MTISFNGRIKCPGFQPNNDKILEASGLLNWQGNYGPNWYHQLSDRQMFAADNLNRSVIEDYENGTINRCKKCLIGIGIKPIIDKKNIALALSLSKGNDIAFIWFLMKIFYSTNHITGIYSLNERLLMSTLCHLDMIMILRKLDEILPICSKKPVAQQKQFIKKINIPKKYDSPYLEPLPKPKILKSKILSRPIIPGPNFSPYNSYKNPNFIIQNEETRWYSLKNRNIINRDEILDNLFSIDKRNVNKLFEQFTNSVGCTCRKCHVKENESNKNEIIVIFKIELDNAISPREFIPLIIAYQCQQMVQECFSTLIFNDKDKIFPNIRICNNCSECKRDFDLLYKLKRLNSSNESNAFTDQYDKYIKPFIFGSNTTTNALELLTEFNKLATSKPIDICVKNIWQFELKLWTDTRIHLDNLNIDWNLSKINPYNKKQMNLLLKKALHEMSKDPKYILPSLPNAYRLPFLMEWIRMKYGYKYTEKIRNMELHKSIVRWRYLIGKSIVNPIVPTVNQVCSRNLPVTFNDKLQVSNCINKLKEEYFHRLNLAWLKDTYQLWPTMKSFMCSTNSTAMRQLFYAYMPANEYDVFPFRPWKHNELNDNVFHRSDS